MNDIQEIHKTLWKLFGKDNGSYLVKNICLAYSMSRYKTLFDLPNMLLGPVGKKGAFDIIASPKTVQNLHALFKSRVEKDYTILETLVDETEEYGKTSNAWAESNIINKDLTTYNPKELVSLLYDFIERQSEMYARGALLPFLDFGERSFVEDRLKNILKEKAKNQEEFTTLFAAFTSPEKNSFSQDQEEGILHLFAHYNNPDFRACVCDNEYTNVASTYPDFARALEKHTKKYQFVYYTYAGPAYGVADFFKLVKDDCIKGVDPKKRLHDIAEKKADYLRIIQDFTERHTFSDFDAFILRFARKMVWAKPRRKDYQSFLYARLEKLHKEIAKRLFLSLGQARTIHPELLENALETGSVDVDELRHIDEYHVCLPSDADGFIFFYGESAKDFVEKYVEKEERVSAKDVTEITGSTAYQGVARGRVRIVNIPSDMEKMNQGDILVSVATTPAVVPAMRKAAAIVSDEGGLTCHAAIVSRELLVPCVVGASIATQVLQDGDLVEVNANTGVVKIVEIAKTN